MIQVSEGHFPEIPQIYFPCPSGNFHKVCTIQANLANIPMPKRFDSRGRKYHEVLIDIIFLFGLTELKAQIAWKHNVCHSFTSLFLPLTCSM